MHYYWNIYSSQTDLETVDFQDYMPEIRYFLSSPLPDHAWQPYLASKPSTMPIELISIPCIVLAEIQSIPLFIQAHIIITLKAHLFIWFHFFVSKISVAQVLSDGWETLLVTPTSSPLSRETKIKRNNMDTPSSTSLAATAKFLTASRCC